MYETNTKDWGLSKYMKRARKDEIICRRIEATQGLSSYPELDLSSDDLRKVNRHAKEIERMRVSVEQTGTTMRNFQVSQTNASRPSHSGLSTTVDSPGELEGGSSWYSDDDSASANVSVNVSVNSSGASPSNTPDSGIYHLAQSESEVSSNARLSVASSSDHSGTSCALPSLTLAMDLHLSPDCLSLETILRSIHVLYANVSLYNDVHSKHQSQATLATESPETRFWAELKHGIYLLKVSETNRAVPVLRQAGDFATEALVQRPHVFVLELLSTLSPVNTSVCPSLRISLLRGLSNLANTHVGALHPITILIRELQKYMTYRDISERGLSFINDLFTAILGLSHAYTFDAERALVRLLRRSGDNDRALYMAQQMFTTSKKAFGDGALRTRRAGRELEHILMDIGDWRQALEVCMTIVGQFETVTASPEPQYNDECAVHTMEDIAKIYCQLEDLHSSIAWLKQAATWAWTLWGTWVATKHIVDKLVAALNICGMQDEADLWQCRFLADSLGNW